MSDRFLQGTPQGEEARRRLRILGGAVFALLALHFVLVYAAPQWLLIPERSIFAPEPSRRTTVDAGRRFGGSESRVIHRDGKRYIWGGRKPSMHFPANELRIDPSKLQYGLGREAFPALIHPEFISAKAANRHLSETTRVLAVSIKDEVKVYPLDLLKRHEVVNDVVGGKPIFAAYCILADLGAVYSRRIAGHTLTFAVSGYTYGERGVWDGKQAFVLWDRDTESLWWPPIGKAVSGPLVDTPMKLLEKRYWSQTTWGAIRAKHPDARVLKPGQDMKPPEDFRQLAIRSATAATRPSASQPSAESGTAVAGADASAPTTRPSETATTQPKVIEPPAKVPPTAIAPRWGENRGLGGSP